ncbi:MAG TPA: PEGA domain-containing protein [Vicinamibacterales bacterium]
MHANEPEQDIQPPVQRGSSPSGRGIAAGMLAIGLLTGFVGGFLTGQRMAPPPLARVADVPRPAPADPISQTPATITETPVVELPEAPASPTLSSPGGEPVRSVVPSTAAPGPGNQPERPQSEAALELASRPIGATVYVDDVRVGVTPVTVNGIRPGTRRVRMELPGHLPWTTSVDVETGAHVRIGASLE